MKLPRKEWVLDELPSSMPVKRRSGPPGCAGGGCGAAERGAGKGGGAEARGLVGGWWAARGFRTWAERPNAGPHVGEKTKTKHEPSSSERKKKNLRSRVFLAPFLGWEEGLPPELGRAQGTRNKNNQNHA
jgi:hypothetical protein